jgi:tetratricopeptide (TPR) repeat protein
VVQQESKAGTGIANEILHNIAEYKRIIHQFEEFLESESGEFPEISNQTDPFRNENIGNKEEPLKSRRTRKLAKEEQDAIISRFIESGNHLERPAKSEPDTTIPTGDLSLSSTSFSDDLVTETLANILEMQGKLEKAIDIYHKLIWKFPQKRAYFATRIEELKEKLIKE